MVVNQVLASISLAKDHSLKLHSVSLRYKSALEVRFIFVVKKLTCLVLTLYFPCKKSSIGTAVLILSSPCVLSAPFKMLDKNLLFIFYKLHTLWRGKRIYLQHIRYFKRYFAVFRAHSLLQVVCCCFTGHSLLQVVFLLFLKFVVGAIRNKTN